MNPASAQSRGQPAIPRSQLMDAAVTSIREFLAFKLGAEEYGIGILRVQEILSYA